MGYIPTHLEKLKQDTLIMVTQKYMTLGRTAVLEFFLIFLFLLLVLLVVN